MVSRLPTSLQQCLESKLFLYSLERAQAQATVIYRVRVFGFIVLVPLVWVTVIVVHLCVPCSIVKVGLLLKPLSLSHQAKLGESIRRLLS